MESQIRLGDPVLLLGGDGERHLVTAGTETERVGGLGVVDLSQFVKKPWGSSLRLGLKDFVLTRPILADHLRLLERRPQIVLPKDAGRILLETGIHAGSRVIEGGSGSGALTLLFAHAVAPSGRVYSYDLRDEHQAVARRNLKKSGLDGVVEFKLADLYTAVTEKDVDAFVADVPDPEKAVPSAKAALKPGAVFVAYCPNIHQAENAHRAMKREGFLEVRTLEILERSWVVQDRGARPDFEMLGHTAFLSWGRRA